mgnify:FL=1
MNELRKGFYVFDMAVFGFFVFALNHTMYVENWIVDAALDLALLLRITVSLLLYKQERLTVIPLVAFVLLYGVAIYADAFHDFITNMAQFPELFFGSNAAQETMALERPIVGELLMRNLIYWVWLIPVAIYVVQFATKLTKDNGYPWYYLIGGIVFKDSVGKLFLSMVLPLFVTFLIGYEMQEYLSFYALMSIPLVGYYFWNRHTGRNPHWWEYVALVVGLYVFDKAQYKVDGERMAYLAASDIIILVVCCRMLYKSRGVVLSLLEFVMMAFLLPTVSLGYNVYQSMEGARSVNYPNVGLSNSKGYLYIKRDVVVNGKVERRMGVRNRYHTTIPCEYKFVLPTKMYSPFATCIKENRDSVVRSVEHGYVLE